MKREEQGCLIVTMCECGEMLRALENSSTASFN